VGGAVLGYSRPVAVGAASTPILLRQAPRIAVLQAAREAVTEAPALASTKDPAILEAPESTPSPAAVSPRAAAPTTAPHPATGVIRVPGSVSGALVDGAPHKASGGALTVACGRHLVKIPGHSPRQVVVPCGGAATF
jgi:hypothetical protein